MGQLQQYVPLISTSPPWSHIPHRYRLLCCSPFSVSVFPQFCPQMAQIGLRQKSMNGMTLHQQSRALHSTLQALLISQGFAGDVLESVHFCPIIKNGILLSPRWQRDETHTRARLCTRTHINTHIEECLCGMFCIYLPVSHLSATLSEDLVAQTALDVPRFSLLFQYSQFPVECVLSHLLIILAVHSGSMVKVPLESLTNQILYKLIKCASERKQSSCHKIKSNQLENSKDQVI